MNIIHGNIWVSQILIHNFLVVFFECWVFLSKPYQNKLFSKYLCDPQHRKRRHALLSLHLKLSFPLLKIASHQELECKKINAFLCAPYWNVTHSVINRLVPIEFSGNMATKMVDNQNFKILTNFKPRVDRLVGRV